MSNTVKWAIGIIVVAVIAYIAWSNGYLGGSSTGQPAAAGAGATDITDAGLVRDIAVVDSLLQAVDPSGDVAVAASAAGQAATAMTALETKLVARVQNLPSGTDTSALAKTMNDLRAQLPNATSYATASIQANITDAQARAYIQSMYSALTNARVDVATVVGGVRGK